MFSPIKIVFVLAGYISLVASQSCAYKGQLSSDPNDIGFWLYSKQGNQVVEQKIEFNNSESLENSAFDRSATKTVILIHGFTDNRTVHMPAVVKPAFLAAGRNYNIIVVDWGLLSASCYMPLDVGLNMLEIYTTVVTENIPIVANRTAAFIQFLNIEASKMYVVGHSLGAHVSGQTGKFSQSQYNYTLSRITGLDPAGPLFTPPNPAKNLIKEDAQFVDIIHTDMGVNGDTSIDGHVDFYPNGGFVQPGCHQDLISFVAGVLSLNTANEFVDSAECSHQFAPILYAASLQKQFPTCKCIDLLGKVLTGLKLTICLAACPSQVILGVDCPTTARGLYSLRTGNPP